jgi:diaminohydroxyphosphoribosylaminopyrimidine deaminase/5-amino-6-(5-phosphoribosylamino)uracil reductase
VYGIVDPNPAHEGNADAILNSAGIEVERGICVEECEFQIRGFTSVQTKRRPWVIAKTAMSLDGKITRPVGEGQWLSNSGSREYVQHLRGEVDAIITSGETVRRDDPSLTIRSDRISKEKVQPLRLVLTQRGLDETKWKLFNDEHSGRTRVVQGKKLNQVLSELSSNEGVNFVLLECGGRLMGEFLDAGLIDEMAVFYAPMVTGGPHPAMGGKGACELGNCWGLKNSKLTQIGNDLCLRGFVQKYQQRDLSRKV